MSVKVSVIIPTYNRAQYLKLALESIVNQDFQDFEIIISDNASTDDTEAIVRKFESNKIQYNRNIKNLGAINNHNLSLSYCQGEYIQIFSDDDIMLPDCLKRKVDILDKYPNVGLVHSNVEIINITGQVIGGHWIEKFYPDWENMDHTIPLDGFELFKILWNYWNIICMPSVMLRNSILKNCNLSFSNNLQFVVDLNLWMKFLLFSDSYYINERLIQYRFHEKSTVTSMTKMDYFNEFVLNKEQIVLLAKDRLIKEKFPISKKQIINSARKQLLLEYPDQNFRFWMELRIKLKTLKSYINRLMKLFFRNYLIEL